jgi:hypothetical protein
MPYLLNKVKHPESLSIEVEEQRIMPPEGHCNAKNVLGGWQNFHKIFLNGQIPCRSQNTKK